MGVIVFNLTKKKLVIIGAGYGGIEVIKNLSNSFFEITLINDKEKHVHQTDIHKYVSTNINDESIYFDIGNFCKKKGINFLCAKVDNIRFYEKVICYGNKEINYDYLVIATGSKSFFPRQIENIAQYSKDIKDITNLEYYRNEFIKLTKNPNKNKNIAIIGGGLSGVEIALEFAEKLKKLNIPKDELRISLIEQFPTILPNSDTRLIENTTHTCDELEIDRYHGNFVNKLENNSIYLSDSSKIDFDMVIINIGVICEKFFDESSVELNAKNQIVVDEYLRIPNHKSVFVIGDIAQTKDKEGKYNLPTAQIAKQQGKLTATNLVKTIQNEILDKNNVENKGVLIDLSGKSAIGLINDTQIKGLMAFLLKRFVSYLHKKSFVV
jgi:NADH dehydrogenase